MGAPRAEQSDLAYCGPAGSRRSASLRLEAVRDLDAIRGEWQALADGAGNPFGTWEWATTWWRHFGSGQRLLVTACRRRDGSLAAILPLYRSTFGPLRVVRFIGHGPGDQLGPVCMPDDRELAARAVAEILRSERWDVFLADRLAGEEGWRGRLGAPVIRRESSPVVRFDGTDWDGFLGTRSAKLRAQVRRLERKLGREHELRYRATRDSRSLPADLETMIALHARRWEGQASDAFTPARAAFHADFAAAALARGWLRLLFLELDGRPVAAWHGFRFGPADWHYQSARDPAWAHERVGSVLVAHAVREACRDGRDEYRFLRGDEEYKSRFASDDPGLETVALGRGVAGRAVVLGAQHAGRLPASGRRAVGRLVG